VIATSPAYHDHPPQWLLQNFPDTTSKEPRPRAAPKRKASVTDRRQAALLLPLRGARDWEQQSVAKATSNTPRRRKKAGALLLEMPARDLSHRVEKHGTGGFRWTSRVLAEHHVGRMVFGHLIGGA
jgi:hypothetical protein